MLISSFPALALGLAALMERAAGRGVATVTGIGMGVLILWNVLFFVQYRFGYISRNAPITFYQLTLGKIDMLKDLLHRIQTMLP